MSMTKRNTQTDTIEFHYNGLAINLHDIYDALPMLIECAQSNNHAFLTLIGYCELIRSSYDSFAYQTPERLRLVASIPWRTFSLKDLFRKEPITPQEKFYYSIASTSKVIPPSIKISVKNLFTKSANTLLEESAQGEFGKAFYYLGLQSKKEKNTKRAFECHNKAATLNHVPSIFEIGYLLLKRASNNSEQQRALDHIQKAATQNYAAAHLYLGFLYAGKIKKFKNLHDISQAYNHYKKASELGCLQAHHNLGILVLKNKESYDPSEGLHHLLYAVQQKYSPSQTYLGVLFCSGQFLNKDQKNGISLLKSASLQQDYSSLCHRVIKIVKHSEEDNDTRSKAIKSYYTNDPLLHHLCK